MDWYPDAGEASLFRTTLRFATGMAPPVSGSRWYRDTGRHDIQPDLVAAGWPPGPEFTVRTKTDQTTQRAGRAAWLGIPLLLNLISNAGGAPGSPFGDVALRGDPQDPANEVEDFPVMWAAPGTVARTLPWQLDPSRQAKGYRTDAVVTDRRLVVLGITSVTAPADVLWEAPRESIARADRREYAETKADLLITFADGSWVRMSAGSADNAAKVVQHLNGTVRTLTDEQLTGGQRERVARFLAELPPNAEAPAFAVLPSGIVRVEARVPAKLGKGLFETHTILMDDAGAPAAPRPGDL